MVMRVQPHPIAAPSDNNQTRTPLRYPSLGTTQATGTTTQACVTSPARSAPLTAARCRSGWMKLSLSRSFMSSIRRGPRSPSSSESFRTVLVGAAQQLEQYPPNIVQTSIYTACNFIPKNLFKQFTRFSNLYFVFITALQLLPDVTSTPGFPTMIVPLTFVLIVSAVRDLVEDLERHRADDQQNDTPVSGLFLTGPSAINREFQPSTCANLRVGELVRVAQDEEVPADLVLLAAAHAQGQCFIMTANLDGESSFKARYVPRAMQGPSFHGCFTADGQLASCASACERFQDVAVECEPPNRYIDQFHGTLKRMKANTVVDNDAEVVEELDMTHVLLKGTHLKDTPWAIGVVVYTGDDTRVRQNASATTIKQSWLTQFINRVTLSVVLAQIVILFAAVLAEKRLVSARRVQQNPFLEEGTKSTLDYVWLFLAYMLLFSNFVPISLQVTIDLTRYFQAMVIHRDPDMRTDSGGGGGGSGGGDPSEDKITKEKKKRSPVVLAALPAALSVAGCKKRFVRVQSSELNEELGLVDHVFTDKTGTLTCNLMEFRSCLVEGCAYDFDPTTGRLLRVGIDDIQLGDEVVRRHKPSGEEPLEDGAGCDNAVMTQFLVNLAVNNSITPSLPLQLTKSSSSATAAVNPEDISYSGPSPDERALVAMAARVGVVLIQRDNATVVVDMNGQRVELQVLHVFEFTSARKKSSLVCRYPDGRVILFCKGADSVILSALRQRTRQSEDNDQDTADEADQLALVTEQMDKYSCAGLRVLCVAERELLPREYATWLETYESLRATHKRTMRECSRASSSSATPNDKHDGTDPGQTHEIALAVHIARLESELTLVGISCIEDKIQPGVPETLERLRAAGITVWMLTGDRPDTATNVGHAVRLLVSDMKLLQLEDSALLVSRQSLLAWFTTQLAEIDASVQDTNQSRAKATTMAPPRHARCHALLLTDLAVEAVKKFALEATFLHLCTRCQSVLCARVSPKQKALLVEMVRAAYPHKVTLAVGDGANDVPMIQRAHIGVGIAGEEGHQASDASDYSIPAFQFLQRLLLVHGRGMHRRTAVLTLYTFYKNVLLVLPQFVFGAFCLFSGQSSYYDPLLQLFNICFTALPVLYFAALDQDLTPATLLQHPPLYQDGTRRHFLNARVFSAWMLEATVASLLVVLVPATLLPLAPWSGQGKDTDLWALGLVHHFSVVCLASARLLLELSSNRVVLLTLAAVSVLAWWLVVAVMSSFITFGGREFFGILRVGALTHLVLITLLVTVLSLLLPLLPRMYQVLHAPPSRMICRELDYLVQKQQQQQLQQQRSHRDAWSPHSKPSVSTGSSSGRRATATVVAPS